MYPTSLPVSKRHVTTTPIVKILTILLDRSQFAGPIQIKNMDWQDDKQMMNYRGMQKQLSRKYSIIKETWSHDQPVPNRLFFFTLLYQDKCSHSDLMTFHQMGGPPFLDSMEEENKRGCYILAAVIEFEGDV